MLSDKRELVGDEIDRRAHQICARLRLLLACQPGSFGDGWCFQNGMRRRCFLRPAKAQRLMLSSSQHGPQSEELRANATGTRIGHGVPGCAYNT